MTFLLYIGLAIVSLNIPIVNKILQTLNTLIHEFGHFIVAILLKCKVGVITLEMNGGGEAITYSDSKMKKILISLSGYIFSSLIAFYFTILIKYEEYNLITIFFIIFSVISLLFWVRKMYGLLWIISFLALIITIHTQFPIHFFNHFIIFLVAILLVDSIRSSYVLVKITLSNPNDSGDAYNLSQETKIPSIIWSFFFLINSLVFGMMSISYWL